MRLWSFYFAGLVIGMAGSVLGATPGTEGIEPVGARESLKLIQTRPGLSVELVACEPAIVDPVAIDWGADGRLWVAEMHDYPTGMDGNWQPGGRIKILEDVNGDGFYEKATLFLENVAFPTGVTAWGKGAFVCAAPDLIYAEDTNGDGKADKVEKVFTGFATENYQARLNSLAIGLDNWVYGANGLLGGVIRGISKQGDEVNIRNHDFRFDAASGAFESVSGLSQYGRARDDWGNWFGCNNSELLLHFPWNERYARRNPAIALPGANVYLPKGRDTGRIFPISRLQERYNDANQANRATSVGGLGIYRDTLLGEEFYGNAFMGEAVHNLVHREVIGGDGVKLTSERANGEEESEFLSSSDNWFRPAQVRTGPDGALYVVDMYRFLIEHPRWIAANRLAKIDVRAGSDKGRIYRVRPVGKELRPIRNLRAMNALEVAEAMDSPNGTDRDRAHVELLTRRDATAATSLLKVASESKFPQARIQALCAVDGLRGLKEEAVLAALRDSDAQVRANALRLSEGFLAKGASENLAGAMLTLTSDASVAVRHQLAYTLGEWNDKRAGRALATLAKAAGSDTGMRLKILTSASRFAGEIFSAVGDLKEWRGPLLATIAASGDQSAIEIALRRVTALKPPDNFGDLSILLGGKVKANDARVEIIFAEARKAALDETASEGVRESALKLLAKAPERKIEIEPFAKMATEAGSKSLRGAAMEMLRGRKDAAVAVEILKRWPQTGPARRMELLPLLMERPEWTLDLLKRLKDGVIQPNELSLSDRQRVLQSANDSVRTLASSVFAQETPGGREATMQKYASVKSAKGNHAVGAEVFARQCATCHVLNGNGHAVGPDLAPLRDKDAEYFLKNILDPNGVIEPRFLAYNVELKDERSILGIIKSENASGLTLVMGGGQMEKLARADVKEIRASSLSLMPAGLEEAITVAEMADLIAYLKSGESPKAASAGADTVLRDAPSVARFLLDESQPADLRENAINANPQFAAALISEMTRDLGPGAEEYRRIPWIWRVAIAAAKRNDTEQLSRVLEVSLPEEKEALRDWQAVVVGGGVINGISQRGQFPGPRILDIIGKDETLRKRWGRALELSAAMADDEKVAAGTRYDALRMLGVEPWEKRGAQLVRYLSHKNGELQMGAVSGLGDVESEEAAKALREALPRLTEGNRKLAEQALARR